MKPWQHTLSFSSLCLLLLCGYRSLKVEMSCIIFLPFPLFLLLPFDISLTHTHTTLTFMHSHISSSSLQMIMCLSTAECAVCQCCAWGQCFSRRTSKVVISNRVYAYPEGRIRSTHIKLNGRNCGAPYGGYRFHLRVKKVTSVFFCCLLLNVHYLDQPKIYSVIVVCVRRSQRSTIWYHQCLVLFLIWNMLLQNSRSEHTAYANTEHDAIPW